MSKSEKMISLTEAFEIVEREISPLKLATETISVTKALGRIIVADQTSRLDLPSFNKSAMDGFAVLADDNRQEYRVLETVPAGGVPTKPLVQGTAIKVMTGAPVPEGTGKVIMIEKTSETNGTIRIIEPEKKNNVCYKGENVRCGDVVLHARSVLGPLQIANLISAGITEVKVVRPLCVSILATGDEIVESLEHLGPGKIMNSNGPMLEALCRDYGLQVVENSIVHDDLNDTIAALQKSLDESDIIILSGGVSVGDFDFVADAMQKIGLKIYFNRVAVKPGKPMTFASVPQKAVFGLPGNPVSVYLMFHLFVIRAAKLMLGRPLEIHQTKMPIAHDYKRRSGERVGYVPCCVKPDCTIEPVEYHGSAHLNALLESDGFFIVPIDVIKVSAGENVNFISLKRIWQ